MVFKGTINSVTGARAYYLCNIHCFLIRKVARMCQISRESVWRIKKEGLLGNKDCKEHIRRGRPVKLSARDGRQLVRAIQGLREKEGNFSCQRIMQQAGISVKDVSVRKVSRFLNSQGYYYLPARKKGVLTVTDMEKRLQFARRMRKDYGADVWTKRIAFYLDCVSYVYKGNPLDQALAPKARIWRKRGEGLTTGCLAKGKKEGTGGRYVRLIVAISYDRGIIACYPYGKMTGRLFANFIDEYFPGMSLQADKVGDNLFVQGNCPCQNSVLAKAALRRTRANLLKFPARCADVLCHENLFPVVARKLEKQATERQITRESYSEFEERVINTFYSIPIGTINKLISSMSSRILKLIAVKGGRIKY